jgi:NIF3 (NGG1p interacting factor 3)
VTRQTLTRRTVLSAIAATAAIEALPKFARGQSKSAPTAAQIVDKFKAHLNMEWDAKTYRDTFKCGDPNTPVKGIAVCFMSTLDVIQRANAQGLNFVITHEPTFWTDADLIEPIKDDPLYLEKKAYVESHNMVVWRIHDHWHRLRPEPMLTGLTSLLGWEKYADDPSAPRLWKIPPTKLSDLATHVAKSDYTRSVRCLGDPDMMVTTVGRGGHGLSGNIEALDVADVDLVSEVREWESVEYIRELIASGAKKGLILLSHEAGEEEGMANCTKFVKEFVSGTPVVFVPTHDQMYLI